MPLSLRERVGVRVPYTDNKLKDSRMDHETTLSELKEKISKFIEERNWNLNARDLAISISLEAAELLEHYQWSDDYEERSRENSDAVRKELADVMIYCLEFAMVSGIDISQAIQEKLEYNAKKYPPKVSDEDYYKIKQSYRNKESVA
jgi:dCTP diphosphatase